MKPASSRVGLLWLVLSIALGCAEEPAPAVSVDRGDGDGDGDSGDGDGDGDGDSGDGDGDGDSGDGDGDGDGDEPSISIVTEEIPKPEGEPLARVVALNNHGHVLIYARGTDVTTHYIWRGADEPLVKLEPPVGYAFTGPGVAISDLHEPVWCLFDDGSFVAYVAGEPGLANGPAKIDGDAVVDLGREPHDVHACNSIGQLATPAALYGSGAPIELGDVQNSILVMGMNDEGALALDLAYWQDGASRPYPELFKPYHGPSGDNVVLGSHDEFGTNDTRAALWHTDTDDVILVPLFVGFSGTPGPMLISEAGDVVVGTNVGTTVGNDVYLLRNGRYVPLGTTGTTFGNPIDINANGQVLAPTGASTAEHAGILFTPMD